MQTPLFSRTLSPREMEIAEMVADGETNAQIAKNVSRSIETVKRHIGRICDKLGADNRTQVAMWYARVGQDEILVKRIAELELENARLRRKSGAR